jgi:hypothetical protein
VVCPAATSSPKGWPGLGGCCSGGKSGQVLLHNANQFSIDLSTLWRKLKEAEA